MFRLAKQSDQFDVYEDTENLGLLTHVKMNERDRMTPVVVIQLPAKEEDIRKTLVPFVEFVQAQDGYGAKLYLQMLAELQKCIPADVLAKLAGITKGSGRYIDKEQLEKSLITVAQKENIKWQINKIETGKYQLLSNKELIPLAKKLSDFKITHASYVDDSKIEEGKFSELAELKKLTNPNVIHYALIDTEKDKQIIACIMYLTSTEDPYAYVADFIVHSDYRSKAKGDPEGGLAQALVVATAHDLKKSSSAITEKLAGVWFIPGGYGGQSVGDYLYKVVFPTVELSKEKQQESGLFLFFANPGQKLLKKAHCAIVKGEDGKLKYQSLDDKKYIEEAKLVLKQSKEPNYTASQPVPKSEQKAIVSPISQFKSAFPNLKTEQFDPMPTEQKRFV